jgi:hypothetical protein
MIGASKKQPAFNGLAIDLKNFPKGFFIKGVDFIMDCFWFFREP